MRGGFGGAAPLLVLVVVAHMDAQKRGKPGGTPGRVEQAAKAFEEIMESPAKGIPGGLLEKAQCVGIVPGMKRTAFVVGGNYGKGFVLCRSATGWSAPAGIRIQGGGLGLQMGVSETDVIFLVMNKRGEAQLLSDKMTIGAESSVAAGPVGREPAAQTDAKMTAEILTYSRTRGLFAGTSIVGATVTPDKQSNEELYGHEESFSRILSGKVEPPAEAKALYQVLKK